MAKALSATTDVQLVIPQSLFRRLHDHLFSSDEDEHGAVIAAGIVGTPRGLRLLAQDLFLARDGVDYLPGDYGYRALQPQFIYEKLHYCRERGLCYLAVHNHAGRDCVEFSSTDLESHRRGYPALLQLARGLPVGALVFADNAAVGELWIDPYRQLRIGEVRVIGHRVDRLYPVPRRSRNTGKAEFNRQILMFGELGQEILEDAKIGIIGAGGAGSIENELIAHLGAGEVVVIDADRLEPSNRSRVVGSVATDCPPHAPGTLKIDIAARVAKNANPAVRYVGIADSVAYENVALELRDADFLFLAADSMQARLMFNALVHQYLIPGIQVGAKIVPDANGGLHSAFSVVRSVTPDHGCLLCNGLIDPRQLALESKDDTARREQDYGSKQPDPSVITMNAVAAAHAVNDFMMSFLGLLKDVAETAYRRFEHLARKLFLDTPRKDPACTECGRGEGSRLAMGDRVKLPALFRQPPIEPR